MGPMSTPRRTRTTLSLLAVVALAALWAGPAVAEPPPDALRALLQGIDTVPNAAQLRAVAPDVETLLAEAARDTTLGTYPRQRAVSLLTVVGGPRALEALRGLVGEADPTVRAAAAYAVGRGFGVQAPDEALAILSPVLDAREPAVRTSAARALAWVGRAEARALLERRAAVEPDAGVLAVIRRSLGRPFAEAPPGAPAPPR